jgi:hypothetical protein
MDSDAVDVVILMEEPIVYLFMLNP